jgi:hypothetical protein
VRWRRDAPRCSHGSWYFLRRCRRGSWGRGKGDEGGERWNLGRRGRRRSYGCCICLNKPLNAESANCTRPDADMTKVGEYRSRLSWHSRRALRFGKGLSIVGHTFGKCSAARPTRLPIADLLHFHAEADLFHPLSLALDCRHLLVAYLPDRHKILPPRTWLARRCRGCRFSSRGCPRLLQVSTSTSTC